MTLSLLKNLNGIKLKSIRIEAFGLFDSDMNIFLSLEINNEPHALICKGAIALNIDRSGYVVNESVKILIDNISGSQIENAAYNVSINGEALTFYCKSIETKDERINEPGIIS